MVRCPKCGTPMDFIGKHNQWYCPNFGKFNPPNHPQHLPHRSPLQQPQIIYDLDFIDFPHYV